MQTRSAHVPLRCFQTDMSNGEGAGEPKSPDQANRLVPFTFGFSGRPPSWGWGHVYCNVIRNGRAQMVDVGGQNLVINNLIWSATISAQLRFQTPRASAQQRHFFGEPSDAERRMTPEQARQNTPQPESHYAQHAKQVDVPEHHRAEQGHHRQHGGRAWVRLYRAETTCGWRWRASNLLFKKWQKAFDHSQDRDVERRSLWQNPQSRSTRSSPRWMWYPMTLTARQCNRQATEVHVTASSSGNVEEPTDSSATPPESSTPEDAPPEQQVRGASLYLTNVLTGAVHVPVTAPAGSDSWRSMEYDKNRLQTASRCRLKLPATCCVIQPVRLLRSQHSRIQGQR